MIQGTTEGSQIAVFWPTDDYHRNIPQPTFCVHTLGHLISLIDQERSERGRRQFRNWATISGHVPIVIVTLAYRSNRSSC